MLTAHSLTDTGQNSVKRLLLGKEVCFSYGCFPKVAFSPAGRLKVVFKATVMDGTRHRSTVRRAPALSEKVGLASKLVLIRPGLRPRPERPQTVSAIPLGGTAHLLLRRTERLSTYAYALFLSMTAALFFFLYFVLFLKYNSYLCHCQATDRHI